MDVAKMKRVVKATEAKKKKVKAKERERYSDIKTINWREVSKGFLEGVEPGSKEWVHIASVLERKPSDKERRSLLQKLGREVMSMYTRYRRASQRRNGSPATYAPIDGEVRYAKQIASNCFARAIHPRELFEYWDEHIGDFTSMHEPPLNFLISQKAIDDVSVSAQTRSLAPRRDRRVRPEAGNSFSDTNGLDPRLRRALMEAGFDVQEVSDRFLLSVQWQAIERAKGSNFFMSKKSKEWPMVEWAAENLYSGEG